MGVFTIGCDDCSTPAIRRSGDPAQPMVWCTAVSAKRISGLDFEQDPLPGRSHRMAPLDPAGEVALKARGAGRLHLKISGQKKAYREVG